MQPSPKGDPNFTITGPAANQTLGPDFSVYGGCVPGISGITAYVGSLQQTATISANGYGWEAVFSGVLAGSYGVYATCSGNGRAPTAPGTIPVTVQANVGVTINPPTSGSAQPMAAGDPPTPWAGWKVEGTYDSARIQSVTIFATHVGRPVGNAPGVPLQMGCDLKDGKWTCSLGFIPPQFTGNNFCIHFFAKTVTGGEVHGTSRFFNGPGSTTRG